MKSNAYCGNLLWQSSLTLQAPGTISRYAYTYDAAGRRIACAKSGSAFDTPDTNTYLYNIRSELTNATAAVDAAYRYGYAFDDIGNRRSSAECGVQSAEYTANNLNQYTNIDYPAVQPGPSNLQPQYDADGNQTLVKTATGVWSITYNGENRPILWTCLESNNPDNSNNQTIVSMSYDRMGRRVTKNNQRFVYNGYLQIANFHSPTPTQSSNYFIWDPTEPVATRPLVWVRSHDTAERSGDGSTFFYTHDGKKNVSEFIAADGTIAAHYEYAPFGTLTVSRGASAADNFWRFSSEYAEDDTDTVYYNYRHYNPMDGHWLSFDPIADLAFSCVNMVLRVDSHRISRCYNLYSYIGNNLEAVDILGLEECVCGPDVTQWLVDQMNTNAQHHVIKTMREIILPRYIPFINLGWTLGALFDFKELVKAGAVWDFKASQKFKSSGCPKGDMCQRTVTICGECVDYDVPGNIHYGYIGRAASLRAWFLHDRAAAAQVGGVDPPDDAAAIDLGIELWDGVNKNFCSVFNKYKEKLNHGTNDKSKGCLPCKEKYR